MQVDRLSHAPQLSPEDGTAELLQKALLVRPTPNQLAWQKIGFAAFLHFGVNTFTDREWGDGSEDPSIFNPTAFDGAEIVSLLKDAGIGLVILTCKHHDGFCLWPSRYTAHSVAASPFREGKGDIVREIADACHTQGLKFGVYLSPWDRHDSRYGDSPAYNDYYIAQLTELLTGYGEVSDVWLDGACAEGPNGKKQVYDWERIYRTVRELAPRATISGMGPDVRWCGNEAGKCRESEWNVVPVPGTDEFLAEYSARTAEAFTRHNVGVPSLCQQPDLGSLEKLREHAKSGDRLYWYPAQVDLSIRPGWFYHASEDLSVRSVTQLLEDYILSVGGNAQLLLNLPPDKRGKIHENDARNLRQLGAVLRRTFSENLLSDAALDAGSGADTACLLRSDDSFCAAGERPVFTVRFPEERSFDLILLEENIANGQRIEAVSVAVLRGQSWERVGGCTVVGSRRLIRLQPVTAASLRITIDRSRGIPELSRLGVYRLPALLGAPSIRRDEAGMVSIEAAAPATLRYTLEGAEEAVYSGPFPLPLGGLVKARAEYAPEALERAFTDGDGTAGAAFGLLRRDWRLLSTSGGERPGCAPAVLLNDDPAGYVVADGAEYSVELELNRPYLLTGLLYLPVASDPDFRYNCTGGRVAVRDSAAAPWRELPEALPFDNIYHNPKRTACPFAAPVCARYVRVTLTGGLTEGVCAAAGIGLLGRLPE